MLHNDLNIAQSKQPGFLMNVPFSLSTEFPNNAWMLDLEPDELVIDKEKTLSQFMSLYSFMSRYAVVYLLPSVPGLQDQTYVANLGIVLPHTPEKTVVISNFYSEPRRNESEIGRDFFKLMKFSIQDAPEYFEGEADLKHIRDNVYVGAYGLRTSKNALDWFSRTFDMKVIPLLMQDEYLYHLDCCVLPLSPEHLAVCTEIVDKETLHELEKYTCIHDVSVDDAYSGLTNSIVLGKHLLCASHIQDLSPSHEDYEYEKNKIESVSSLCSSLGMEPVFFNLSEFCKSGALLSCLVMHLNRNNYIMGESLNEAGNVKVFQFESQQELVAL
ncbi:hypothetical protein DSM106972_090670 [Dulcicalothrix desertica PCC 7102]|uniref:Amidinotransferase n=1 Tax=Dulcicalothrix desertica PCC 7102 TaxID=232991 RepID=A0A3S1C1G5_9CYAN|nr:arginine deiminase-related protein [Dulcicalothrix desertica]RUS95291.1 hypothetical protein DSM106972_090670 [Dulcicalothrix desertica PCC 7102]TWH43979.1 N-dimethylarginine dimethylaminohydrolase [Dulcicalothrix desertica PCC 7102]